MKQLRAMILAAGYGTRLWPLTADRTKPALPVLGRPLVGYVAEYLAGFGIKEVAVNLHYQPESVRAALGDGGRFGVNLKYVYEPEILGTSGAWDNAREWLEGGPFVVINGKIVTDIDLRAAYKTHLERNALATLVLQANPQGARFSQVVVREGLIQGFGGFPQQASDNDNYLNKPTNSSQTQNNKGASGMSNPLIPLMFTGIQILSPEIFRYIPRGRFSHSTTEVYPAAIAQGETIAAHIAEGYWYELSTPERYWATNCALLQQQGSISQNVLGTGASIETGADVTQTILWEGAQVQAGAQVHQSVLGAGVRIPAGLSVTREVWVRGDLVAGTVPPAKALTGYWREGHFVVPLS